MSESEKGMYRRRYVTERSDDRGGNEWNNKITWWLVGLVGVVVTGGISFAVTTIVDRVYKNLTEIQELKVHDAEIEGEMKSISIQLRKLEQDVGRIREYGGGWRGGDERVTQ